MAGPTPPEKQSAASDAHFFERFVNAAFGSGLSITAFQQATNPGTPDPFTAVVLGIIGLLGVIGQDRKIVSRRIADDPARPDFLTPTRARPARLEPEHLGDAPPARVASRAAQALWRGNLALEAYVRALERAMGAEDAGHSEAWNDRLRESNLWAGRAADWYVRFAPEAEALADQLEAAGGAFPLPQRPFETPREVSFEQILPADVLATLYRIGIPIRMVRRPGRPEITDQALQAFATRLREAAQQSRAYGEVLVAADAGP